MLPGLLAVEFQVDSSVFIPSLDVTAGSPSSWSKLPPPLRYFPPPRDSRFGVSIWFACDQPGLGFFSSQPKLTFTSFDSLATETSRATLNPSLSDTEAIGASCIKDRVWGKVTIPTRDNRRWPPMGPVILPRKNYGGIPRPKAPRSTISCKSRRKSMTCL